MRSCLSLANRQIAACLRGLFVGQWILSADVCEATQQCRQWTVYLAQDKDLDYNWCRSMSAAAIR